MSEIIYEGTECRACIGKLYKVIILGGNEWKRCIECGQLSPVKSSEVLVPLEETL